MQRSSWIVLGQPWTNGGWSLWIYHSPVVLGWRCILHGSLVVSSGTELNLPRALTSSVIHLWFGFPSSRSLSKINYLHTNPCLRLYFLEKSKLRPMFSPYPLSIFYSSLRTKSMSSIAHKPLSSQLESDTPSVCFHIAYFYHHSTGNMVFL